ncbi:sulfite exporter TauE/SafE family protein [Aliiglaciecola sp. LCG003]|uniref:sulfite exporter TauE/SafE family protein n=1 Tax=Aliiglaciecola sp. LCG003 TaxID=3053655 RepID=UPI002572ADDE|nr:sulfite exporter TauE/SafE family protein [Aliiglaciecola sp. LCG003]WJG10798.1 sulfite exporter TauE/SafE family protein [Aliiglaciecola sp. LCG003]
MNILTIIGAIFIGLSLGLLGSGGSIITVPLLIYVVGEPTKLAIAESLLIVGCISSFSSIGYIRRKLIDWPLVVLFGLPSMLGTYVGAWSSQFVLGIIQLISFAAVMLIASRFMLKPMVGHDPLSVQPPRTTLSIIGFGVGALAGFVGVGGGFLIVPALHLLGKIPLHRAVGTSLVIIVMQSISGFIKYQGVLASNDIFINWSLVGVMILIGIAGAMAGVRLMDRLPQLTLKRIFAYLLIVLGSYMLVSSLYTHFTL